LEELLSSLFGGCNFFFGNPIKDFLYHLKAGHYNPAVSQFRHAMREVYKLNNIRETKEHIDSLIKKSLEFQKQIGIPVDEKLYHEFFTSSTIIVSSEELTSNHHQEKDVEKQNQRNVTPYYLRQKRYPKFSHIYSEEDPDLVYYYSSEEENAVSIINDDTQRMNKETKLNEWKKTHLVSFPSLNSLSFNLHLHHHQNQNQNFIVCCDL
jgi:predicted transcriptional regulator